MKSLRIYKVPKEKITVISTDPKFIRYKDVLKLYSKVAEANKHER